MGNQYIVTGTVVEVSKCDCSYCEGHQEAREFRGCFAGGNKVAAAKSALNAARREAAWGAAVSWKEAPHVVEKTGGWFYTGEIAEDGDWLTNLVLLLKKSYATAQPITSDKKPKIGDFLLKAQADRRLSYLSPNSREDGVILTDGNGYTEVIDVRYYEMLNGLGVEFWKSNGYEKDGHNPVLAMKANEIIGAVMPMRF